MSSFNETSGSSASGTGMTDRASETFDAAKQKMGEQAQKVAQTAKETMKSATADLTSEARNLAGDAAQRARSFADENKGKVAEQVDSLAGVLNRAADELEGSSQPMFAGYARQLAGGVQNVSTTLREKGVEELFGLVGNFARKQPALFIGGAALLGFAVSRLAVATARSQSSDSNWGTETDQNNWAPNRNGSPEIREPWQSGQDESATGSAWGDNASGGTSGTSGLGGSAGSYGSGTGGTISGGSGLGSSSAGGNTGSSGTGTNGQWNSTRDSEGGTI